MSLLLFAAALLGLAACGSAILLARDATAARLHARLANVRNGKEHQAASMLPRIVATRQSCHRSERTTRLMRALQLNPDIAEQNVIAWPAVLGLAGAIAVLAAVYGSVMVGWPLASVLAPPVGLCVARCVFGWERLRFQRVLLEQIPDVMGLICRAVAAGIPLSEALRSVAQEAPAPSRTEFARVVNDTAIGLSTESALWSLHERSGLPEYGFFAVTIGLQAQTGGSLVETLQNLQDLVRKRVALSKRGKALAAEARMSAMILGALPVAMCIVLYFLRPGFFDFFLATGTGYRLLLTAVGLMVVGILVMRQLIVRSLAP